MTSGSQGSGKASFQAIFSAYMAIMRPYLITTVGLLLALGCLVYDNWRGALLFALLALFPYALRMLLAGWRQIRS